MSSASGPDADQLEAAADQAIAACGGDAREAVKALIVANAYLETDLEKLKAAASMGYARRKAPPCSVIKNSRSLVRNLCRVEPPFRRPDDFRIRDSHTNPDCFRDG
jgi:hypothetical protein